MPFSIFHAPLDVLVSSVSNCPRICCSRNNSLQTKSNYEYILQETKAAFKWLHFALLMECGVIYVYWLGKCQMFCVSLVLRLLFFFFYKETEIGS